MNGQTIIDGQVRSFARPQFLSTWNSAGVASLSSTPTAFGIIQIQDNIIAHWLEVNWTIAWGAAITSASASIIIALGQMSPNKVLQVPSGATGLGGGLTAGTPNILFHLPYLGTLAASVAGSMTGKQMIPLRSMNITTNNPIVMYFASNGGGGGPFDISISCSAVLAYNSQVELPRT